jgi:hypothetical protein
MTQLLRERLQSSWKITFIDAKLIELLVEGDLDLLQRGQRRSESGPAQASRRCGGVWQSQGL